MSFRIIHPFEDSKMISASCCEGSRAVKDLCTASQFDGLELSDLLGRVRIAGADVQVCAPSCIFQSVLHRLGLEVKTYDSFSNRRHALRVTRGNRMRQLGLSVR